MATTIIHDYSKDGVNMTLNLEELRDALQNQYAISRGDEDKAGSIDDACYYEGWANSLEWVLCLLTGADPNNPPPPQD